MSELYKQTRDKILSVFKYFGISMMVEKWVYYVAAVVLFILSLMQLTGVETGEIMWLYIIPFVLIILLFFRSKSIGKRYQEKKLEAVEKFIEHSHIQIAVMQKLIEEIEKSIKSIKIFATWNIGICATFVALFITLMSDSRDRIIEMVLQVSEQREIIDLLQNTNLNDSDLVATIVEIVPLVILIAFIVVGMVYMMLFCFIFSKKQVLTFLYDVQYELMTNCQNSSVSEAADI